MTREYPDRENTLSLLADWQKHHAAIEKLMDGIKDTMGLDIDGPLFEIVWALFSAYTDMLERVMGVEDFTWLPWYCFDNDMGDKGHEASPGNGHPRRPVRSLDDLAQLILESRG